MISKILIRTLDKIRGKERITKAEIAKKTGMCPSNVTRFFNCENEPSLKQFEEVARAIGVNLEIKKDNAPVAKFINESIEELGLKDKWKLKK